MDKFNLIICDKSVLLHNIVAKQIDQSLFKVSQSQSNFTQLIRTCERTHANALFIDRAIIEDTDWPKLQALSNTTEIVLISNNSMDAAKAFEYGLFDFILQPITLARVSKTLSKLKKLLVPKHQMEIFSALMHKLPSNSLEEQIVLKDAGCIKVLTLGEISWVGGAGNYVELHTINDARPLLHRQTLSAMEQKLLPFGFIRIHRSALIKKHAVREIRPTDNGDYIVTLKSGTNLNLSRRYKQNMSELIC